MTTLKNKHVITRKPHPCSQCSRVIAIGERVDYYVGIPWQTNEFEHYYICGRCETLILDAFALYPDLVDHDTGVYLPEFFADYSNEVAPEMVDRWKAKP